MLVICEHTWNFFQQSANAKDVVPSFTRIEICTLISGELAGRKIPVAIK
jgi:hypothetical protein